MRLGIGAMFLSVFFENLNKGLYAKDGYAKLINYYVENSHAPALWKSIMSSAASHATVAGPLQGVAEISFGVFLLLGLLTRPVALAAGADAFVPTAAPVRELLEAFGADPQYSSPRVFYTFARYGPP